MAAEHIRALQVLRGLSVEQRRKLVTTMAAPDERGGAQDLRDLFLTVQMTIEAIDRALKDESLGSMVTADASR